MDFERTLVKLWWHLMAASPSQKWDITTKSRLRKVGVSWEAVEQVVFKYRLIAPISNFSKMVFFGSCYI
jgi:hypothetical protein